MWKPDNIDLSQKHIEVVADISFLENYLRYNFRIQP